MTMADNEKKIPPIPSDDPEQDCCFNCMHGSPCSDGYVRCCIGTSRLFPWNFCCRIQRRVYPRMAMNPLMKAPTDDYISKHTSRSKLSDFATALFWGRDLHTEKKSGDRMTVSYLDKSVEAKIEDNKRYKCWYEYSDASDPADSSTWYYIVYVEEVPQKFVEYERMTKNYKEYIESK